MEPIEVEGHWQDYENLTYDGGRSIGVMNHTEIGLGEISQNRQVKGLMSQLTNWVQTAREAGRKGGMLDRSAYSLPEDPYNLMRQARTAVRTDDVIGAIATSTEALAFEGGFKWESGNIDDADYFNQLSALWNLDAKIREMWRETFATDQVIVGKLWDWHDLKPRGATLNGNAKKTVRRVWAPRRLVILDPLKVVPIGDGPLRVDDLAWNGGAAASRLFSSDAVARDPLMASFFTRVYEPDPDEMRRLQSWGVTNPSLLQMNPEWVFRHCNTKPDYEHFPDVRLRSVFPLLDLKRNQMNSDRATLIGAANYILLIRKGSDEKPATNEEIANLRENYNFLAKVPVIVADHRLQIDIIAPSRDFVLRTDAYDTIDKRILASALSTFASPGALGSGAGSRSQVFDEMLAKVVSSQRHMIKRTLERELARAVVEHPRNAGVFKSTPSLAFTRRNVRIGTDQAYLSTLWAMRQARETSRDTILEFMGLDESVEAQRLTVEEQLYDKIFKTVSAVTGAPQTPGSGGSGSGDGQADTTTSTPEAPSNSGRRGGRPLGGRKPGAPSKPGANGAISDNGNPSRGQ